MTSLAPALASHPWAVPIWGKGGNRIAHWLPGHGFTECSKDSCSCQVSCWFGYVFAEETKHFFFPFCLLAQLSKTSGPAGEKERLQTSRRVSTVFLGAVLPEKLTASLYYSWIAWVSSRGWFPAIDKMAKALAACQILFCGPKLLSLFRQSVIYLTVVALRIFFIMLLQIVFSEWLWFASALVFELKAESFFSPFSWSSR